MKYRLYGYEVTGGGTFPVDMLRYDCCWPAGQDDVTSAFTPLRLSLLSNEPPVRRTVTIRGLCLPTEGRWRSFGWKPDKITHKTVDQLT